MGHTHSQLIFV